jgi:hypothetical protein
MDVPKGIHYGFDLSVDSSPTITYIPHNHYSALDNPMAVQAYIETELKVSRYLGPFDPVWLESIIGPFHCSPLDVIEEPEKFRIIQRPFFSPKRQ